MAKKVRKVDEVYLRRVARWYVERWDGPAAALRRALMRRVMRSARAYDTDPEQAKPWVEAIVAEMSQAGIVDDTRVAERVTRSGRNRGWSRRKITAVLQSRGLSPDVITSALADVDEAREAPELEAAFALARRRHVGPWRTVPLDPDRRRKELGVLARGGFSWQIATRIVDAPDVDALEDALV